MLQFIKPRVPAGVGAAGYRMARQAMADKAISDAGDAGLSFLRDRLSRVPRGGADLWPLCLAALPDAGRRKPRAGGPQSWLRRSGPKEFLRHHWYVEAANRARLVVVQVLSARSIENSHFDNPNADLLRAKGNPEAKLQHSEPAYDQLLRTESRSYVEALVAETRRRYVEEVRRLLRAIEVPKLLFWFSQRKPDDQEKFDYVGNLFHHFPQLVNRAMIDELAGHADRYFECITSRGLPQPLISRFTGEPVRLNLGPAFSYHNNYYPSPEMHEDAAPALAQALKGSGLIK